MATSGARLGATHSTGWAGLRAKLIQEQGEDSTIVTREPFTGLQDGRVEEA